MSLSIVTIGEAMVEFRRADDTQWRQGFAGDTLNVAWAIRALLPPGMATVRFVSRIGTDGFSDRFHDFLTSSGISTDRLERDADRTIGLYTIETDETGERDFSYWRGQSAARRLAAQPDALREALGSVDLAYFSGITLAILPPGDREAFLDVLAAARRSGTRLAFDPNIRPRLWEDPNAMRRAIEHAAALSDMVLPTFDDETLAFGDADPSATLDRYEALGVTEVIVKDGIRPTRFLSGGRRGAIDVPHAVSAVDTTGAGDSFNGACLAGRLNGLDLPAAIRCGQRVSRAVVGERGALVDMGAIRTAASGTAKPG